MTYAIVGQSAAGAGTISGSSLTANTGTGWVDVQATKATEINNVKMITKKEIWHCPLTEKLPTHNQKVIVQLKDFSTEEITFKVQKAEWFKEVVQCWKIK